MQPASHLAMGGELAPGLCDFRVRTFGALMKMANIHFAGKTTEFDGCPQNGSMLGLPEIMPLHRTSQKQMPRLNGMDARLKSHGFG